VGELFIDEGDSLSEILTQTYEYYEFHLSANSIKKWVKNQKNSGPVGRGIDSFVIANAKSLLSVDFACMQDNDDVFTPLTITPSASTNSISFSLNGTVI